MLSARNIAALGFMTFAMYLGAGNLIFPPFLGLQAGEHFASGMAGFLLTGVGLPALALVMVALVNGSDNLTAAPAQACCDWFLGDGVYSDWPCLCDPPRHHRLPTSLVLPLLSARQHCFLSLQCSV